MCEWACYAIWPHSANLVFVMKIEAVFVMKTEIEFFWNMRGNMVMIEVDRGMPFVAGLDGGYLFVVSKNLVVTNISR